MAFGGEIDDGARLVRGQQIADQIAVADVAANEDMAVIAVQPLQRIQIAGIGQLVEIDDRLIEVFQPVENKIPTDESSAPRNQYRHSASIPI